MQESNEQLDAQRRAHFRMRYPEAARPQIKVDAETYLVTELSEGGLRLALPDGAAQWAGPLAYTGVLRLPEDVLNVKAEYLRDDGREVVFRVLSGVTLRAMMQEQKRLVRQFPALYGKGD